MTFNLATTEDELTAIEHLANIIWTEHYTPIIGSAQVTYMLNKFQSLEAMRDQLKSGYTYVQIVDQNKLLGYMSYEIRGDALFLSKFYVDTRHRKSGVGRASLNWIKSIALSKGLQCIELTVNKYNTDSISIYEHLGFRNVKAVVFDIGNGYIMDDFLLRMDL